MKRAINNFGLEAKAAFAKVGVLMASARRTAQALHPTNLHVNKALFPRDTIQSRLPDPEWLEQWLDTQINFDSVWENKVVDRILHNMEAFPSALGAGGHTRCAGGRCHGLNGVDNAHQIAIVQETSAAGDDPRVSGQRVQDLDLVTRDATGLHLDLGDTVLGA